MKPKLVLDNGGGRLVIVYSGAHVVGVTSQHGPFRQVAVIQGNTEYPKIWLSEVPHDQPLVLGHDGRDRVRLHVAVDYADETGRAPHTGTFDCLVLKEPVSEHIEQRRKEAAT